MRLLRNMGIIVIALKFVAYDVDAQLCEVGF